jgi:hypothetical protein
MRFTSRAALAALAACLLPIAAVAQTGPAWSATHLPADVLSLVCAPSIAADEPAVTLRVSGGQAAATRMVWAPGDLVTINAGRGQGIAVGQEFFVRRLQRERDRHVSRRTPATIRTAGWLRVYAVDDDMSLATIQYACDTVLVGDYLEPFALPAAVARTDTQGTPERDNYARVLAGNDRRRAFGTGEFFVIDRGADHGIVPGSQFVVYHDKHEAGHFLFEVGEAVAVDVRESSATLHVISSRSPVVVDDYVALRK